MSEPVESELKDQQTNEEVKKPLHFIMPPGVLNHFSNFTFVQNDVENNTFVLSFFEIQKPPLMGSPEEIKKVLEGLENIPAVCVARIVVTPKHFEKLVAAMQSNLEQYENIQKA
jgi:hypothetical protein